MKRIKLAIRVSDNEFAETLARMVAMSYGCFEILSEESEDADMVIDDDIAHSSERILEMLTKAAKGLDEDFRFDDRAGLCGFTAFTSGCGGSGVSTSARLYGSVRSALEGKKVLLLSLDPYVGRSGSEAESGEYGADTVIAQIMEGRNLSMLPACISDACGLYVPRYGSPRNPLFAMPAEELEKLFICLEDSGDWDEVVIDMPRASRDWLDIMYMCEKRVVIFPADERAVFAQLALEELECGSASCAGNRNYIFEPSRCESGEAASDIYGPAGCEVRKLAKAMANG